jgi:protein-disulfide isomerase
MDVVIRVFGPEPGCAKCKGAEKVATEVAQKFQGVTVKKCDVFSDEAEKYNIMMTPTVMVNDITVEVGRIPSAEKLESAVEKVLGDDPE